MSMYNRYIPQPDGSYRKNLIQDNIPPQRPPAHIPPPQPPLPPQPQETPCPPEAKPILPPPPSPVPPCRQPQSAGSFLRQLLPKNMDTGDLLVILLLLLMAGDSGEDKNSALITLALYLML